MNPELRDFKSNWVELPTRGSGNWFLHLWIKHGNDTVTEMWLTTIQAESMGVKRAVQGERP